MWTTSLKLYPCYRHTNTAIAAGLELREKHGDSLSEVENAKVSVNEEGYRTTCEPGSRIYSPSKPIHPQFNIPHGLALALDTGPPTIPDFITSGKLENNEYSAVLPKITTEITDSFGEKFDKAITPAWVEITTTDSQTVKLTKYYPK